MLIGALSTYFLPLFFIENIILTFSLFDFLTYVLGEANFLGGVASVKGVEGFNPEAAKKRFFEIYLDKVDKLSILYMDLFLALSF